MSPVISGGGTGGGSTSVIAKVTQQSPTSGSTVTSTSLASFSTAWQLTGVVVSSTQSVLLSGMIAWSDSGTTDCIFALFRGSTQIATLHRYNVGTQNNMTLSFSWVDAVPGAGTYTYEIKAASFTSGTITIYNTNPTTDTSGGTSMLVAQVFNP